MLATSTSIASAREPWWARIRSALQHVGYGLEGRRPGLPATVHPGEVDWREDHKIAVMSVCNDAAGAKPRRPFSLQRTVNWPTIAGRTKENTQDTKKRSVWSPRTPWQNHEPSLLSSSVQAPPLGQGGAVGYSMSFEDD